MRGTDFERQIECLVCDRFAPWESMTALDRGEHWHFEADRPRHSRAVLVRSTRPDHDLERLTEVRQDPISRPSLQPLEDLVTSCVRSGLQLIPGAFEQAPFQSAAELGRFRVQGVQLDRLSAELRRWREVDPGAVAAVASERTQGVLDQLGSTLDA